MAKETKESASCGDQKPQDPIDQHDTKYDNDVAPGWLRGSGAAAATAKPGFDKHRAGR